jgi:hypothetical protein
MLYRVQPSAHIAIRKQAFWLSYVVQRKDFRDQAFLPSLDWWQYGPSVKWRMPVGPNADMEVDYTVRLQRYDEAVASNQSGSLVESNPTERHVVQRLDVDTFWRATSTMQWRFGYCFEKKDDRFEDFESWTGHCARSEMTRILLSRFVVRGAVLIENRHFDNRLGDSDATLRYNRLLWESAVGWYATPSITLFASVSNSKRVTNRTTGSDYRDFDILRFSSGLSFTY